MIALADEFSFKLAFGAVFACVLACALRAAYQMKKAGRGVLNQQASELPALKFLRPALGIVFYGAVILWLASAPPALFALDLPPALRWAGFALALAGAALAWASVGALGRNYAAGVALYDDHELVTRGPYGVVRHPVYAAFLIIMAGGALLAANWLAGASGLLLTALVPLLRVGPEERLLASRFGAAWDDYRRRMPALAPRLTGRSP